jgi:DNA polymerase-3 subunit delta
VKPAKGAIGRSLDRPDPAIRFYLFYGPDEGQSRGHGERLLKALEAEKSSVSASAVKSDSALLADEAGAIGLFGGKRALWIEPASDEIAEGVAALLDASGTESPVVAIGGALRKTSPLVKLAEAHPMALAHISYELNERDMERVVDQIALNEGLRLAPGVASRIATTAGNDRGIIIQEVVKLALYVDASREAPARADHDDVDAIGVGAEGDSMRLGDLALSGELGALSHQLDISAADAEPISVVRALQRRLLMLAPIRARVDGGERPHDAVTSAGKSVFWKDKERVVRMVSMWDSKALARVLERSGELERRLMRSDSPPDAEALEEELVAIARSARRK